MQAAVLEDSNRRLEEVRAELELMKKELRDSEAKVCVTGSAD